MNLKINSLITELRELSPIKEENQKKLDKKFRMEFNFNSNHIEGNTLTYSETELYLIFDKTKGNHIGREYEEMKAHDVAYNLIIKWASDYDHTLTEVDIRTLNEIILVEPFWKDAVTLSGDITKKKISIGKYKTEPNHVRLSNGKIFEYSSPEETAMHMGDLMDWYNNELDLKKMSIVELASLLHYKFVRIHPFDDGNGRVARLLINYILLKNSHPPVIIRSSDKHNYLFALNEADSGNTSAFVNYIAQQLLWSLQMSVKAAKNENIDELGDLEKKMSLLKLKSGDIQKIITLKYGLASVVQAIEYQLKALVDEWEMKLKEFDTLFFSRNNIVTLYANDRNGQKHGNDLYDVFVNVTDEYFRLDNVDIEAIPLDVKTNVTAISLSTSFIRLRKLSESSKYQGGTIKISFFDNAYDIAFTGSSKTINKLYDEDLTEHDRSTIIESIGNAIVGLIEEAMNNE